MGWKRAVLLAVAVGVLFGVVAVLTKLVREMRGDDPDFRKITSLIGADVGVDPVTVKRRVGYLPEGAPLVGVVARLEPEKGHPTLLEAWPLVLVFTERRKARIIPESIWDPANERLRA